MKYPNFFDANGLLLCDFPGTVIDGKWYKTRPLGCTSFRRRIRGAWLVLTGRADALVCEEQLS